jgi:hypothetical protein
MKKFVASTLAVLALIIFTNAHAQQQKTANTVLPSPTGLLAKFNGLVLSDLQQAEAIAKAAGDDIADKCYLAVIDLVQKMQTISAPGGSKDVQIVTAFEKARLLLLATRAPSPVFVACAPFKAQVKQDSLTAPGALLSLF